jgi:pectinesterase
VPERFGDMAWENDRIAHRMYGAPLNGPDAQAVGEKLRGSGVDVWAKRVTYPIVDRWYAKGHDQFHKDGEGEGLDLYSIGGSRGDGGTGVWDGQKLWTSDNFVSARVLSNGPRRAAFSLAYDSWPAGDLGKVEERKNITVDCGVNFDAVETTFGFPGGKEAQIGIGITEHPQPEGFPAAVLTRGPDDRWMSLWEENKDGGLGTAVILGPDTPSAGYVHDAPDKPTNYGNHLLLVKARDSQALHYFAGAGWNRSGQFKTRADWEAYVKAFAATVANPLKISVAARP